MTAHLPDNLPYLLCADDDPDDQELLSEHFLSQNPAARIEFLNNGMEVLSFLQKCELENLPLIILLDYKMPILTGAQVLEILQGEERYAQIPKFVWSTSGNRQYVEHSLRHGAQQYFTKPNNTSEMHRVIVQLSDAFRARITG